MGGGSGIEGHRTGKMRLMVPITSRKTAGVSECRSGRLVPGMQTVRVAVLLLLGSSAIHPPANAEETATRAFLEQHCYDCHDAGLNKGGLDLTALAFQPDDPRDF